MLKKLRNYLTPVVITVGVFMLGATAFAVAGAHAPNQHAAAQATADHPKDSEADVEAEAAEESTGPNHGHCVSWAAHQSKTDGYSGKDRGEIISAVAKAEDATSAKVAEGGTPDSACSSAYSAATAGKTPETAATTHGSTSTHGKSESHSEKGKSHAHSGDDND